MTDTPLLRLARIVAQLTWDTYADGDARTAEAEQLVRDLEAAPHDPMLNEYRSPAPERRTITREEWAAALDQLTKVRDRNKMPGPALNRIMEHFRLTVEDAP